ncbi:putative non-heme bromoperoxidase BpoC [Streptomyces sp. ADI98-12]|uniref:alpha/beta fold hydrolase n=1 Tax=Streptomyces sp. ADI98-12 TaxID=1522764 RepID=UPI000F552CD3|nr:alpha/beta hydrolase [Streptomyces sp. ADI98-12]RPK80038.1 putative non-heme bromoperoxidase BpoC [Streptomyces sp. ADI98-12]
MPIATVNETRLRYDVHGSGEPVVMVMGSGSGGRVWEMHQVPALVADGYQVVTFDDRGVSQPDGVERYGLDDMVADVAALVEHLSLGSCRFVGTSLGALTIQELAIRRPDLVYESVLMATRGRTDTLSGAISKAEIDLIDESAKIPVRYQAVVQALLNLSRKTLRNEQDLQDWLDILEMSGPQPSGLREQLEASLVENRLEALSSTRSRTLVIGFQDDLITPPHLNREVADAIPGSTYIEVTDCGHYGYLERPSVVNKHILDFFSKG